MPASSVENCGLRLERTLGTEPAAWSSGDRRKCERIVSLWYRHRSGETMPPWSDVFLADADELTEYCISGTTDTRTAAVSLEDLGARLRDRLSMRGPDGDQTAARAAILVNVIVHAAQGLNRGRTPRPVSHVYADHKSPGKTVKSRFVILPFTDDRAGGMRWLALGDWCTVGD